MKTSRRLALIASVTIVGLSAAVPVARALDSSANGSAVVAKAAVPVAAPSSSPGTKIAASTRPATDVAGPAEAPIECFDYAVPAEPVPAGGEPIVIDEGFMPAVELPAPVDGGVIVDGPAIDVPIDADWQAEMNAEQEELSAYLTARGIANTMHTENGSSWVEYDYEDAAAQTAVEDFYWDKHPMPQEVIDQINADANELVAYLTGRGFTATVVTDRHGLQTAEFDWADQATSDAVADFYWEKSPIPQEQIEAMNAEQQRLVDFLTGKGFTAKLTVDRHGMAVADFEWTEEIGTALQEYYGNEGGCGVIDIGFEPAPISARAEAAPGNGITVAVKPG